MTTPPAIAYILLRYGEACEVNRADARAARTPEERAFVNGQKELLNAFGAWIEVSVSATRLRRKQGKLV